MTNLKKMCLSKDLNQCFYRSNCKKWEVLRIIKDVYVEIGRKWTRLKFAKNPI